MKAKVYRRSLWLALSIAVLLSDLALAQQRPADSEKAITVEPELLRRFDAGRKWAIVIGVNDYIDQTIPPLRYCIADARLVADTLAQQCGYETDRILLLTDDQPKSYQRPLRLSILERVPGWLERAAAGDTVLLYFSGHGFLDDDGQSYLAPQDCRKKQLATSAIRTDDLRNMLDRCAAAQKLLILDCCHAGGVRAGKAAGASSQQVAAAFEHARGLITLASCAKEQLSQEWDAKRQGLFTYYLAQGLKGGADFDRNGIVDSDELYRYTMDQVVAAADRELNARQTPVRYIPPSVQGVFALARVEPKPAPLDTRRQVTATFTVREQDANGPLAPGVTVELLYRPTLDAEAIVLGRATSDSQGAASMPLWLTPAQQREGEFLVLVTSSGGTRTDPLPGFPKTPSRNLYVAGRSPAPQTITNSIGMKFVLIPAGEFMMGSSESDSYGFNNEKPQHRVRITRPFYLGVYEVTVGQFRQFVEASAYQTEAETDGKGGLGYNATTKEFETKPEYTWRNPGFAQTDTHPVVNVSWNDAVAFCRWLSQKEGQAYRLPTEAEWEYACRAGTTTQFWHGDDPEGLADVGNVSDVTAKPKLREWAGNIVRRDGYAFTAPVGMFRPNGFGLYDMHGNVNEWCADWYDEGYYRVSPVDDPAGPAAGPERVLRGGDWRTNPWGCRAAYRCRWAPSYGYYCHGFRLARSVSLPSR